MNNSLVRFQRAVVVPDTKGMTEEQIEEAAVTIWNEEIELEDMYMDKEHIVEVTREDGTQQSSASSKGYIKGVLSHRIHEVYKTIPKLEEITSYTDEGDTTEVIVYHFDANGTKVNGEVKILNGEIRVEYRVLENGSFELVEDTILT